MYYKLSTQKILFFFGFKSKQTFQTTFQGNTAPTMTAAEFFSLNAPYKNDHILFLVYCYLKTSFNNLKSSSSTKLAIFLLF